MPVATISTAATVALVGNPNTGKSTLFNALAGVHQRVGNYPGVTVEKKIGHMTHAGQRLTLVDLPGTYSLAPRSPDEMVTVEVLLGQRGDVSPPNAVLCILDASNLERNLYLVSQVLELGLPTVVALNMMDVAESRGVRIDAPQLERQLGVPVVCLQAHRGVGVSELKARLATVVTSSPPAPTSPFPAEFQRAIADLSERFSARRLPRFLLERLVLDAGGPIAERVLGNDADSVAAVTATREKLIAAGTPIPAIEAISRYEWVGRVLDGVATRPDVHRVTWSDRLDKALTHKIGGTLVFVAVMVVMFQSVFTWAKWLSDFMADGIDWLGGLVGGTLQPGALQSLLVDGVIAGVGGVVTFLPQILILFGFIAVLEDCGYMARAAYLMDKLMSRVGLSGKSFIPLLSSFACAIPGVMATRVIENRRDRLTTILVAPLMSCSARLPVYSLLVAAFIPQREYAGPWITLHGVVMAAMYFVGIAAAVAVAWLLKRTILRGETPAFVMELPSYKFPSLRTVVFRMFDRGWAFVRRAGTLVLAVAIVVWAAGYFPRPVETVEGPFAAERADLERRLATIDDSGDLKEEAREPLESRLAEIENEIAGAYQRQSYLARAGQWIEPVVRPLGWDWRIGCAAIASFPAREVVVGTLGVIYNLGDVDSDESKVALQEKLRTATWDGEERLVFTVPVALSIMVFFSLCAQCAATLAVIKRETNSWRWPIFTFTYMTVLAYVGALVTFQVGTWLVS